MYRLLKISSMAAILFFTFNGNADAQRGVGGRVAPGFGLTEIGSIDVTRKTNSYQVNISRFTTKRDFDKLVVIATDGGHGGVIINTLLVKNGGRWIKHRLGLRTKQGRNNIAVNIPRGASELRMSLASGADSKARFFLEKAGRGNSGGLNPLY